MVYYDSIKNTLEFYIYAGSRYVSICWTYYFYTISQQLEVVSVFIGRTKFDINTDILCDTKLKLGRFI